MTKNKLTRKRIDAAIAKCKPLLRESKLFLKLSKDELCDDLTHAYERNIDHQETVLAALDAVRWRKPEENLPSSQWKALFLVEAKSGLQEYKIAYVDDEILQEGSGLKIVAWLPLLIVR